MLRSVGVGDLHSEGSGPVRPEAGAAGRTTGEPSASAEMPAHDLRTPDRDVAVGDVGASVPRVSADRAETADLATPAFALSLLAAAGLAIWWRLHFQATQFYHLYYRLAAICLVAAAALVLVIVVAAMALRRSRVRASANPSMEPAERSPSPASD